MEYNYRKYRIVKKKTETSWGWGFSGPTIDVYHIQGLKNNWLARHFDRIENKNWFSRLIYEKLWATICDEDINCCSRINGTGYFQELSQAIEYFNRVIKPDVRLFHKMKTFHKDKRPIVIYDKSGNEVFSRTL